MSNVKFTGILKLSLDDASLARAVGLWTKLPVEAKHLSAENLHVTLVHQSHLKPFKSFFSGLALPEGPNVILDDEIRPIVRSDKKSWIVLVKNQDEMRGYVDAISDLMFANLGTRIVEDRVFHVSLANLDGSPFASVGDVKWDDVGGRDVLQR